MKRSSRSMLGLVALTTMAGCASPARHLHPVSGDVFTLFPEDRNEPPAITCSGKPDARFACFVDEIAERAADADVSGTLVLHLPTSSHMVTVNTPGARPKVTPKTRLPLASVTKMFLGATVVSLAEKGTLDVDLPISKYLSELKSDVGPGRTTLHQLLTHTAGLPMDFPCSEADDIDDAVVAFRNGKLWAPPGAVFNYSNLGYTYVAAVIERATGQRFEDVVRQEVLVPIGAPEASFDPSAVTIPGQTVDGGPGTERCRALRPAGGLAMNIVELSNWVHAVSRPDSSSLDRRIIERLTAPHVKTGRRPGETYGYGVFRFFVGTEPIFAHGGLFRGYSSFVAWAPRHHAGGAALANAFGSMPAAAIARGLSTFLTLPVDWQGPTKAENALARYAGTYVDRAAGLGRVRVTVEGDGLAIDYPDGPPPLWPVTFRFFFDPKDKDARYVVTEVGVGERETDGVSSPARRRRPRGATRPGPK